MSVQVEKLEKNMAKLTVEVSAEDFKAAIKKAFNKNSSSGYDRKDVWRRRIL